MEIFYREKAFDAGKKLGIITLTPQKNFPVTPLFRSVSANNVMKPQIMKPQKIVQRICYTVHSE